MGKINKIGTERVIAKKTYNGDFDIDAGNKIIAENSDLEGFDESLKNDKKKDVVVQPRTIHKDEKINELSNMKRAAGSSTRFINSDTSYQRKSYLHKRGGRLHGTGRPKVNILALVDDAIEDGATDEAKKKASAGRAALTAPIPAQKKVVHVKRSIAEGKNYIQSIGTHSATQKTTEKLSHSQNLEESTSSSTSVQPVFGSSSSNSVTPAWKVRLEKKGKKIPEVESFRITKPAATPKPELKPWQVRIKAQEKKMPESSSYENNSSRNYKSKESPILALPSSLSIPPNDNAPVVDTDRKEIPGSAELIGSTKEKKRKNPIESKMNNVGPTARIILPTIVKPKNDRCGDNDSSENCNNDVTSIPDTDRNDHPDTIEPSGSTEETYPLDSKAKPIVVDASSKFVGQTFAKLDIGNGGGDKKSDKYEDSDGLVYDSFEELTYKDSALQCGKKLVTTRLNISEEERSDNAKDEYDAVPKKINFLSSCEGKDSKASRTSRDDMVLDRLRQEIDETKKRLDNVTVDHKRNLLELEHEFTTRKKTVSFSLLKKIQHQEQKNKKLNKEYENLIDKKKMEIDELRLGNQRLRIPLKKLPQQMAQMIASNNSLEKSNEEIAGHLDDLRNFSEKLQNDQDLLLQSSDKCKNEYFPRYRQELWERQEFLDAEIKIKNLYRDCNIRITKKIERSRQIGLIESVSAMVLETEGEVNPKFDPKFLFKNDSDSNSSTSSDFDDSDSDGSDTD